MARTCAIQLIAVLKAEVGDLSKVKRIVRVGGFVNCTDDFTAQPKVINGASDLLVAVFGDAGRHAREDVRLMRHQDHGCVVVDTGEGCREIVDATALAAARP